MGGGVKTKTSAEQLVSLRHQIFQIFVEFLVVVFHVDESLPGIREHIRYNYDEYDAFVCEFSITVPTDV